MLNHKQAIYDVGDDQYTMTVVKHKGTGAHGPATVTLNKFDSEPWRKLYGNQSQYAFYPNCTDLIQFLLFWTLLCHNINHVALV